MRPVINGWSLLSFTVLPEGRDVREKIRTFIALVLAQKTYLTST
jgi:hypothetical protein